MTCPRPLCVPASPKPGEGIVGVIMRTAAANGLSSSRPLLRLAGIGQSLGTLPLDRLETASDLAVILGLSGEATTAIFQPETFEMGGFHDVGGAWVRRRFLETSRRRVSPRTLRERPWHHDVWQVRSLPVCPISHGEIIDSCPECGEALGFRITDPCFCDLCGADLRDAHHAAVDVDDKDALNFYLGLLSPSFLGREIEVPEEFWDQNRGIVAEVVVLLARLLRALKDGAQRVPPLKAGSDFHLLTADLLAEAARIVLDWDQEFPRLMAMAFNVRRRQGSLFPELEPGALFPLMQGIGDAAGAVDLLDAAIRGYVGEARFEAEQRPTRYVCGRALRDEFGLSAKVIDALSAHPEIRTLRSTNRLTRIFDRDQIVEILDQRDNVIPLRALARTWAAPESAIKLLMKRGLLTTSRSPIRCLYEARYAFDKHQVKRLENDLREKSSLARDPIRLDDVPGKWTTLFADVVEATIAGAVSTGWGQGDSLYQRLRVARRDLQTIAN